jgi:hypothetical protein
VRCVCRVCCPSEHHTRKGLLCVACVKETGLKKAVRQLDDADWKRSSVEEINSLAFHGTTRQHSLEITACTGQIHLRGHQRRKEEFVCINGVEHTCVVVCGPFVSRPKIKPIHVACVHGGAFRRITRSVKTRRPTQEEHTVGVVVLHT